MYDSPGLTFCLLYLAGSRQTPAGCGHQSSTSCGFQRCGKLVFAYLYCVLCVCGLRTKRVFLLHQYVHVCFLFFCRMTASRLSFWRWQSSILSQSSWCRSIGTFWSPSGRSAGPPAYQGEAFGMRSTPQPVPVILCVCVLQYCGVWCVVSDEPLVTRCCAGLVNTGLGLKARPLSRI